jgi:hypothetical protein
LKSTPFAHRPSATPQENTMHRHCTSHPASGRAHAAALCLAAVLAGCGGGDFAESFVKLITARFVPASISPSRGSTVNVDLEVTCDRAGLNTPFGRLGVQVKLDPESRLPAGITATPQGSVPDQNGFYLYPCNTPTGDPDLLAAHVSVRIVVGAEVAAGNYTLVGFVQVEPLASGEPSKDSTTAELAIHVSPSGTPPTPGGGSAEPGHPLRE